MRNLTMSKFVRPILGGVMMAALMGQTGCIPVQGEQFREAALPAIQTGMTTLLTGVLDGMFAAIAVESDSTN